jgi:hypothetical protein
MGKSSAKRDDGDAQSGGGVGQVDSVQELGAGILRIFNQAYASGRRDVARALIDALDVCLSTATDADTQAAARKARLWIDFVHARDRYVSILEERGASHADTALAARSMREAYMRWCGGADSPR